MAITLKQFHRGLEGPRVIVDGGTYEAELVDVFDEQKADYENPDIKHDVVTFKYKIESDEGDAIVYRSCKRFLSLKSNLRKDLKALGGQAFEAISEDDDRVKDFINNLVGKKCLLTVEIAVGKTSGNRYNKFISVSQMVKRPAVKKPQEPISQIADIDDDIPF